MLLYIVNKFRQILPKYSRVFIHTCVYECNRFFPLTKPHINYYKFSSIRIGNLKVFAISLSSTHLVFFSDGGVKRQQTEYVKNESREKISPAPSSYIIIYDRRSEFLMFLHIYAYWPRKKISFRVTLYAVYDLFLIYNNRCV